MILAVEDCYLTRLALTHWIFDVENSKHLGLWDIEHVRS